MRIGVLTTLYPGPPKPHEGLFAERRWVGMAERGHTVWITQPLPYHGGFLARGSWKAIGAMPRRERRAGLPVERPRYLHVPGWTRPNARRFARVGVRTLLAAGAPDVVVLDYAWPAAAAAHGLARRGIPCVVSGRGSDVHLVSGAAGLGEDLGAALRAAGHWCAVSRGLVEAMDRLAGRPGQGVLVPNGVSGTRFPLGNRGQARRALGLDARRPLVLVVGHLIERKDPLLALEVFHRGAPPESEVVFVGSGPLGSRLAARIEELGLASRARMVGETPPEELARWYAAANVLLLTSRSEGRPNVVLEALSSGRPVLATDVEGTRELLEPWAERFLVPGRDVDGLARALADLLADPPPPEEMRARVEPLTWERSFEALERCLERAMVGEPVVP